MNATIIKEPAHPVDVHVGVMLRILRKRADVSQQALAAHLGLSFQQVQKYEHGTNRISASKLHEIAQFLRVPIGAFFDGLDSTGSTPAPELLNLMLTVLATREGQDLTRIFASIPTPKRQALLEFARLLEK